LIELEGVEEAASHLEALESEMRHLLQRYAEACGTNMDQYIEMVCLAGNFRPSEHLGPHTAGLKVLWCDKQANHDYDV
jgi:hypothetical protein